MNFKTLKNLVATTIVGLWVTPTIAYSQVTVQDYIGLSSVTGGWHQSGNFPVIAHPTRAGHIQLQGSPGSWFTYQHNGQNYPGFMDNSGNVQSWSQQGRTTFNGNKFTHFQWGDAVIFNQAPSQTWTYTQKLLIGGVETTISTTTPNKNSTVNATMPTQPNATFLNWSRNGTVQSTPLPSSFTITTNTTVIYSFRQNATYTHNISLPPDSYTARAVTITSNVQGALVTGHILQPGQTFSGSYFTVPGETITVVVDGVTVSTHTFPLESPMDYIDNISLQGVPQPTPTPTPTPSSIFNQVTNPVAPPTLGGTGGGGGTGSGTGSGTIFNGVDNPDPLPNPPPQSTNTIPNPFGTFNTTNNPLNAAADFYGVIKQAITDGLAEQGLTEQQLTDVSGIDIENLERADAYTQGLNSTTQNLYNLGDEAIDTINTFSDFLNSILPDLDSVGTSNTYTVNLQPLGTFSINLSQLPGRELLRSILTFYIWLYAFISAIHIIRKGIA